MLLLLKLALVIALVSLLLVTVHRLLALNLERLPKLILLALIATAIVLAHRTLSHNIDHGNGGKISYEYVGSCHQRYSPADIVCVQSKRYRDTATKDF